MAVSYIGRATGTTSATLPSHQAGDLIIGFAFRDGSNTSASLPAGWTAIRNDGLNTCAGRLAYKIAASSSETSGTWTSATSVIFHVYRGANIGSNSSNTGSSTTVNYPALTLSVTDGTSWVSGFSGHRSTNTNLQTAPSGMTNRSNTVDATDEAAGHDTNGGVASWSSTNVSVGGTSSGYRSYVLEIISTEQTLTQSSTFTNTNQFYTITAKNVTDDVVYNGRRKFNDGAKYGSFTQTLVPALFVNENVFYGGTVETFGVTSPEFINENIFYNHTVTAGPVTIQAPLFQNENTFYSQTVTTSYNVSAPFYEDPDTFYNHSVAALVTQSDSFVNENAFYGGAFGVNVYAPLFVNTNTFYGGSVKGRNEVLQSTTLLNNPTFYRHFIQKAVFNNDSSESELPYIENESSGGSPFGQTSGGSDIVYIEN